MSTATVSAFELHRCKESKSREPVRESHPIIAGVIRVLDEQGGGPLTSVAVFRRGVELGLFEPEQYNSLRARLSQHCDLDGARVIRAPGSKVGVRGSRTTAWVLSEQGGVQVERRADGLVIARRDVSEARRRQRERRRVREVAAAGSRNLVLTDGLLAGAPQALKLVAGRTAREALTSRIDGEAARWLIQHLPLEPEFRARLATVADDAEARGVVIEAEERRRARA